MKSVLRTLAILTAVSAIGSAASAATEADLIEFSGNFTGGFNRDHRELAVVGLYNYYLIPEVSIGLEAMLSWDKTFDTDEEGTDVETLAFSPHLRIDYYFNSDGDTVPYIGAVMGAAVTKDDSVLEEGAHIGVKQFVDRNASLNAEVGYLSGRKGADGDQWILLFGISLYDRP